VIRSIRWRGGILVLVLLAAGVLLATDARAEVPTRTLHSFSGPDGADPGALVETGDGTFLGVTSSGGDFNLGTIFRMTPNGTVTLVHSFAGGTEGASPLGPLVSVGVDFYGVTSSGGDSNNGTIFKLTAEGSIATVHHFAGGVDGRQPSSPLRLASDGRFYGTTRAGGTADRGTVYRAGTDGSFAVLSSFAGGFDGEFPGGALIEASDGSFYGSADGGYSTVLISGLGILYKVTPDGTFTLLHRFVGTDGIGPSSLAQALDGQFYGTTISGGPTSVGTVFRMAADGTITTLHAFAGSPNGAYPGSALIQATDGALYGTTTAGGRALTFSSTGTAFRITRDGAFSIVHVFRGDFDADEPRGLYQASDGNLYGPAVGGTSGVIFRIDTLLCEDSLRYVSVNQGYLNLGFRLHSWAPGTWSVWAFYAGGVATLWSLPLQPIVPPAYQIGIGLPGMTPVGPLGILTVLDTPSLGSRCLDWKVIDTGLPPRSSSR
jgi:uncharacterized repeat protein (TIGR03803 family)